MHILIADAHADYCSIVREYLRKRAPDATVTVTCTTDEALAIYDAARADLVITAQCLPSQTGVGLIRLLRARSATLPIIMHTVDDEVAREALAAGATAYIRKDSGSLRLLLAATQQVQAAEA